MSERTLDALAQPLLAFFLIVALAGCDIGRWELKEDKQGRLFRLDKWFGGVLVIEGDKFVKVKSPDSIAAAAEPKNWPEITLTGLGQAKASLRTSWRNGLLHYRFEAAPAPETKTPTRLSIKLYDKGGFALLEIPIGTVSERPPGTVRPSAFGESSSTAFSYDEYRLAKSWVIHHTFKLSSGTEVTAGYSPGDITTASGQPKSTVTGKPIPGGLR